MAETKYSQRRLQEFARMSVVLRKAMDWRQCDLGVLIRCAQGVVSYMENPKSGFLRRTELTRRRGRRLTVYYKAYKEGRLTYGMSIEDTKAAVLLPPSLRKYIPGEEDGDLEDTLKLHGTGEGAPRFNSGLPAQAELPVDPPAPPVAEELPRADDSLAEPEWETKDVVLADDDPKLEVVEFHGMNIHAARTSDGEFAVSVSSVCNFLGIDTRGQVVKMRDAGWAARVISVRGPDGRVRDQGMIHANHFIPWVLSINHKKVRREARLQLIKLREKGFWALKMFFGVGVAVNQDKVDERGAGPITAEFSRQLKMALEGQLGKTVKRIEESLLALTAQRAEDQRARLEERVEDRAVMKRSFEDNHATLNAIGRQVISSVSTQAPRGSSVVQLPTPTMVHIGDGVWQSTINPNLIRVSRTRLSKQVARNPDIVERLEIEGLPEKDRKLPVKYIDYMSQLYQPLRMEMPSEHGGAVPEGSLPHAKRWLYDEQEFLPKLLIGYSGWLLLGRPSWKQHEVWYMGKKKTIFYPNIEAARKKLTESGFSPSVIEANIAWVYAYLPFLGEKVEARSV